MVGFFCLHFFYCFSFDLGFRCLGFGFQILQICLFSFLLFYIYIFYFIDQLRYFNVGPCSHRNKLGINSFVSIPNHRNFMYFFYVLNYVNVVLATRYRSSQKCFIEREIRDVMLFHIQISISKTIHRNFNPFLLCITMSMSLSHA